MNEDMRRMCDAVARAQAETDPRERDMREAIVRAVLRELRLPTVETARACAKGYNGRMMAFHSAEVCGLYGIQAAIDHVLE